MAMVTAHRWDSIYGGYMGWTETDEAFATRENCLTLSAPPHDAPEGMGWVMTADGAWSLREDYTATAWHDPYTGDERWLSRLGQMPPVGWVKGRAPNPEERDAQVALVSAIEDACSAIEAHLDVLGHEPIAVDGVEWDADAIAQRNISGKLSDITQRQALGLSCIPTALLVWRDASNVDHVFSSQEELCELLGRMWCAISDRATALYIAAWQHKANVRALTTMSEVTSYDIMVGWSV